MGVRAGTLLGRCAEGHQDKDTGLVNIRRGQVLTAGMWSRHMKPCAVGRGGQRRESDRHLLRMKMMKMLEMKIFEGHLLVLSKGSQRPTGPPRSARSHWHMERTPRPRPGGRTPCPQEGRAHSRSTGAFCSFPHFRHVFQQDQHCLRVS